MDEISEAQLTVLELVVEDGTPFCTLGDVLTPKEAQAAVRDLWHRGLVTIERVEELDEPPDRPVSAITPGVRSTSRITQESLTGEEARAAIGEERNWRHMTAVPAGRSWYEVTTTPETEPAYLAAARSKDETE